MKTDLFQSCGHCWVFQICWQIVCSTFTASSFKIWNSSTGIPSPPLALFVVMLSKAHLTSHSRMSGSRWVITSLWLSGSLRPFLYSSPVYSCHLFLISSASVRSIPFLSFIMPIFAWNVPLVFLEGISSLSHSVVFLYFFALIAEEGFLISSCYSLELCIQMLISFLFFFAFHFSSFHRYSVQFSCSVMSDSLRPHESQHARPPCPSPTPRVHSDSGSSSQWCHPAISSSVVPFSSCPQSLPTSESFPLSQLFAWGGQSIGISALASVLPKNTQDWPPLEWTGWISLQSKTKIINFVGLIALSITIWDSGWITDSLTFSKYQLWCQEGCWI